MTQADARTLLRDGGRLLRQGCAATCPRRMRLGFRPLAQKPGIQCNCRVSFGKNAQPKKLPTEIGDIIFHLWTSCCCGRDERGVSFTLVAPVGIRAAIRLMEPEATVAQPEYRLRWSWCGNRQVGITVHPDTHPHEIQAHEGSRSETRAGLPE